MEHAKDWDTGMSGQADAKEQALTRQARFVSLVIAGTMILWMVAQWAGSKLDVPEHYVFLVDLFALAGFLWALIVTFQIWRKRRAHG